jgi:hypothetical protein
MPNPSRTGGGAIRPVDGKSMHSSSRASSLTGQHGLGSQASGLPSYPANIVPAGSQGQPYRGQAPPPQDGRTTPGASEKIVADMTAEEVEHYHQLMRDHKELSKFQFAHLVVEVWR